MFHVLILLLLVGLHASESFAQSSSSQRLLAIDLKSGRVVVRLHPGIAPRHVERIEKLAREGFYDGMKFHRVISGFIAQTGDPKGNGKGGSKYPNLRAEFSSVPFQRGTVGMARGASADSANSQFFICTATAGCNSLKYEHTIWGEVIQGIELVDRLAPGEPPARPDVMLKVSLIQAMPASAAAQSRPAPPNVSRPLDPDVAEKAEAFRRDPADYFKCMQLKLAYSLASTVRPFEQEFPELQDACATAKAASEAAEAKRKAEWRPAYGPWLSSLALGFVIGGVVGLVFGLPARGASLRGLYGPIAAAGTSAAIASGLLNAGLITQEAAVLELSSSYSYSFYQLLGTLGMSFIELPGFGAVMLSEVAAATAAGGAGLALMAGSKLANMQTRAPIEEARSAQEIFTRRALPVSLAAGVALIIAGYTVAPRDYSGLSIEGRFLVGTGIMALVVLPLVHAWRTASSLALFGAAASLLAGTFLLTQYADAGKTRDMLVVAGGILGFWSAIEGWRYFRVGGRGLLRATRFVFTWPFTSASVVQATARRLSGENLVAAYHLPEHTALARQVVNRELTARGEPPQVRNDDWLPEPHRATLGPAVARSIPADRYTRYVRNRLRLVGVVRVLGVVGVVTVVGLVVIAPLLSLIVSIGGFLGRKRAGRVLLLRPFNQARMTAALKTVVRTHIGPLGHVVTLSDRNYRPNFALAALTRIFDILTLVVGPLLRPSFRIASVKDERSFFKFAAFLSKKWRPSSFGLLCSDQAFNVRTTDHWWKRCIDLLLRSSDVIVMDISRVSAGSAWEITQLSERGLLQSCIFICQKDYLDEARATFSTLVSGGFQPDIQAFTAEGVFVDNAAELKAQLVSRMASAAATWGALRAP